MEKLISKIAEFIINLTKGWNFYFGKRAITKDIAKSLLPKLQVGDVLLVSTRGEFTNFMNPMEYKHGLLFLGLVGGAPMVIEATTHGAQLSTYYEALIGNSERRGKDKLEVRRPIGFSGAEQLRLVNSFGKYLPASYDYNFDKATPALYCFELVAKLLLESDSALNELITREFDVLGIERSTYAPSSFQSEGFKLIYKQ